MEAMRSTVPMAGSGGRRGEAVVGRVSYLHRFFIDGVQPEQKAELLDLYRRKNLSIAVLDDHGTNLYLELRYEAAEGAPASHGYYPDVVENIGGKKFYILKPDQ